MHGRFGQFWVLVAFYFFLTSQFLKVTNWLNLTTTSQITSQLQTYSQSVGLITHQEHLWVLPMWAGVTQNQTTAPVVHGPLLYHLTYYHLLIILNHITLNNSELIKIIIYFCYISKTTVINMWLIQAAACSVWPICLVSYSNTPALSSFHLLSLCSVCCTFVVYSCHGYLFHFLFSL